MLRSDAGSLVKFWMKSFESQTPKSQTRTCKIVTCSPTETSY